MFQKNLTHPSWTPCAAGPKDQVQTRSKNDNAGVEPLSKHLTKYFYYLVPENTQSLIQTAPDNNYSNRIFVLSEAKS